MYHGAISIIFQCPLEGNHPNVKHLHHSRSILFYACLTIVAGTEVRSVHILEYLARMYTM